MFGYTLFQRVLWGTSKRRALLLTATLTATLLVGAPADASGAEITTTNWWPGNGNANDVAGTQNGTLMNGAAFAPGKVGQAFSFDGVDDHVSFGSVAGNVRTEDFTLAFWLKTTSSGRHEGIIGKRPACAHGSMFDVRLDPTGKVYVELDGSTAGTDYNFLRTSASVNDGTFHHIAIARKGTAASLYLDGRVEVTKSTPGVTNIINGTDLVAGKSACTGIDGTQRFTGLLDEIVLGPDRDTDGRPNVVDNCPSVANGTQDDSDGDGTGDICQAPAPPLVSNLAPADGASSVTSTPTLSATYDDPNPGDDGHVEFEVYRDGSLVASSAAGSPTVVQPGQTAAWQVPSGKLQGGRTYAWRARAFDGSNYSPWTSSPASRALTIGGTYPTVDQWTADEETGRVDYTFRVSAAVLSVPGDLAGPCYQIDCSWKVEARHSHGSVEKGLGTIASGTLAANTSSMNETLSGVLSMEVTDIRTIVEPGSCYGCLQARTRYDSGWTKVRDRYGTGDISLDVKTFERDVVSGSYTYDLAVKARGAAQIAGPCQEKACRWKVEARYDDGFVATVGSKQHPMGTWTVDESVSGTATGGKITDLRATLESMCAVTSEYWCWDLHETYTTGWMPVSGFTLADINLDPLVAFVEARAITLDEFCIRGEERARALRLPDATPSTTTHSVTEACQGASTLRQAIKAMIYTTAGTLVVGSIINTSDGDNPNQDAIRKVPAPETDVAGSGVRPPTSCLDALQKALLLQDLQAGNWLQNHHIASNKHSFWTKAFEDLLAQRAWSSDKTLRGAWNVIEKMPHRGNHPSAYHAWVYRNMEKALREAPDWASFETLWQEWVVDVIENDPTIVRWEWWRC